MADIINIQTRVAIKKLSPLATVLMNLVEACQELIKARPLDPNVIKIKMLLAEFDREMNHD